jgi:methionyl-tRNA formyltransferase
MGGKTTTPLRLIFAGTPEFAQVAMQALHDAGHQIVLVLTQPDRPAGRGMKLQASPVKQLALSIGAPVAQPRSLRLDGKYPEDAALAQQAILDARADACVVAAYGLILPQWVLDAPRLKCFNIHGSLLPRWRGAAPIHRAIEAGDALTGITIMQMDAGLDTGDMLAMETLPIQPTDTTGSLHDQLAALGARMMVQVIDQAQVAQLVPQPQPAEGVTYAAKIDKHEAAIDWSQPASTLARRVRAFNPFPGAHTTLGGELLKIWAADAIKNDSIQSNEDMSKGAVSGTVVATGAQGIDVQTGDGVLRLTQLQRAGAKRLAAADFVRGQTALVGVALGQAG